MPPGAAGLQERRRTYEGCRDLHQTRSVLAAVSGVGRAPRERVPPSFGPLQEGLRIWFETPEEGQEPRGNRASGARPCCLLCTATYEREKRSQEPSREFRDHQRDFIAADVENRS